MRWDILLKLGMWASYNAFRTFWPSLNNFHKWTASFQTKPWNLSFDDFHSYDEHCVVLDFGILMKNPPKCVQTSCKSSRNSKTHRMSEKTTKKFVLLNNWENTCIFQCKMMHFVRAYRDSCLYTDLSQSWGGLLNFRFLHDVPAHFRWISIKLPRLCTSKCLWCKPEP